VLALDRVQKKLPIPTEAADHRLLDGEPRSQSRRHQPIAAGLAQRCFIRDLQRKIRDLQRTFQVFFNEINSLRLSA
jgi:hypothetical protein